MGFAEKDGADTLGRSFVDDLFNGDLSAMSREIDAMSDRFRRLDDSCDAVPMAVIRDIFTSVTVPDHPWTTAQYLAFLDGNVLPHCSHLAAPTYLGHMTSPAPKFLSELGRLVLTLNQNVMKMESSRGLTFLEREVLGMMHRELYGLNEDFYSEHLQDVDTVLGIFTSGGTIANITAMWIAFRNAVPESGNRHRILWRQGYEDAVVIGSELMHYSFDKGADMLGLSLLRLPVDAGNRLDMQAMRDTLAACERDRRKVVALVGVAGTTDFGSVDPLAEICALGREKNIHVHIDAAWGGGLLFCREGRGLLRGIDGADSVTIDGHKQLMLPIGSGMLFLKSPALSEVVRHHAPYAVRPTSLDQGRFTLEGTRPAASLYLHAALHLIGRDGYDLMLSASLARARQMAQLLEEAGSFELASPPVMNILLYRYIPAALRGRPPGPEENRRINDFNVLLQKRQRQVGTSFVSRTQRALRRYPEQPLTLMRAVLLNPLTSERDIQMLIEDQQRIGRELERELGLEAA